MPIADAGDTRDAVRVEEAGDTRDAVRVEEAGDTCDASNSSSSDNALRTAAIYSFTTFSLAGFSSPAPGTLASSRMPAASRTLFSISKASSGFSRRNSRALSLPWPIFSPL